MAIPVAPHPDPAARRWGADIATVAVLFASVIASVVLFAVGVASALCGEGRGCAPGEESRGGWMILAAPCVFLAVPVVVAVVRRNGWWLLAPVVEGATLAAVVEVVTAVEKST